MKKIIYSFSLLLFVSLFLFSCSKDFLDTKEDRYITKERIDELKATSPESVVKLVQGSLNGMYNANVARWKYSDDFGMKAIHLATDLGGIDVVQLKHHWFGWDYNFDNRMAPWRRTNFMWGFLYKQISSANIILKDFFAEPFEDENFKIKEAETRAWRGIAYYYLINLYQQTYKGNENAPGVPLVLNPTDENMPRVKVSEVYAQIIKDLEHAIAILNNTESQLDIDKAVAAAYLAKTYATMENWEKVVENASIAIDGKPIASADIALSGSWNIGTADWLWGYDITGETTTYWGSFHSNMSNSYGYSGDLGAFKAMYSNLYKKMGEKDIRRKLYPEDSKYISRKYYKTPNNFTGDYCFLRTEDPLLLLVEAYVELNKLEDAKATLSILMKERDEGYDVNKFSSQDELREELRIQRRIELWGEGTSFFDFKRWKMGYDRAEEGSNHRTKVKVESGDKRWVYQIPQKEMESNPNIGSQNP